ncbi:HAD-IA family hydrolase [Saccharopolyspora elongata]|uniref:HAD-IA family hydrolase n=1 Tax=Saccharopolyspora elongata TaxID=2530387 RepID=UPI001F20A447|nr:HAD-IA family hydrolase [Saccharopolyspora elongata]
MSLADDYEPFPAVAASALRTLARGDIGDAGVAHVVTGFAELPAHPDVEPAMKILAESGTAMVCLTNGAEETTEGFLRRNGLEAYVDQIISVSEADSWKPRTRVYRYALERLRRSADEVALVAVHAFDCHGAKRAGLTVGWASRLEGHYAEVFRSADVTGTDLVDVVRGLLELPQSVRRQQRA